MYMWSFRNEGAFHEKVTNDHPQRPGGGDHRPALMPASHADWYVRGGIYTNVVGRAPQEGLEA